MRAFKKGAQDAQQHITERSFLPLGTIRTVSEAAPATQSPSNTATVQAGYQPDSISTIGLMLSAGLSH